MSMTCCPGRRRSSAPGGTGLTFSKAVATTRVLCQITAERFGTPLAPAWHATRAAVTAVEDYWDWFGADARISGVRFWISFEPTLWGEDDASSPVRISLSPISPTNPSDFIPYTCGCLLRQTIFSGKLSMLSLPLHRDRTPPGGCCPFRCAPGITSEEARDGMASTVTKILAVLADQEGGAIPSTLRSSEPSS